MRIFSFSIVICFVCAAPSRREKKLATKKSEDGVKQVQNGELKAALETFKLALDLDPTSSGIWANIGRVQMDMGNTKEALTSFSRGLEIDPANILLRENIENLKLKTGDAVGTDGLKPPNDRDKRLAKKRSKAGVEQMRSGEFKKAFISFSDSLELDPTSSETWLNFGQIQNEMGDFNDAKKSFQHGLDLDPNNKMLIENIAKLDSLNIKEIPSAQDKELALASSEVGVQHVQKGKLKKALAAFKTALDLDPTSAGIWCNLGRVQKDLKLFDDAQSSFNRGLAIDPNHALLVENMSELESRDSSHKPSPSFSPVVIKKGDIEVDEASSNLDWASSVTSTEDLSESILAERTRVESLDAAALNSEQNVIDFKVSRSSEVRSSMGDEKNSFEEDERQDVASLQHVVQQMGIIDEPVGQEVDSTDQIREPVPPPLKLPELPRGAPPSDLISFVTCSTTKGPVVVAVYSGWAPQGAARFLSLVESGFFNSTISLFRAVKDWIVQFGISNDPNVNEQWARQGPIQDDPQWLPEGPKRFKRRMISFAGGGPNTRSTQLFIAYRDNHLGSSAHEVPFGWIVGAKSFRTLEKWYTGYGEMKVFGGNAPDQGRLMTEGAAYLNKEFPLIDYINSCEITWQSDWTRTPRDKKAKTKGSVSESASSMEGGKNSPLNLKSAGYPEFPILSGESQVAQDKLPSSRTTSQKKKRNIPPEAESFFWWLDPLNESLVASGTILPNTINGQPRIPTTNRHVLSPGNIHVFDDFLSAEELRDFRAMTLKHRKEGVSDSVSADSIHKTKTNDANNIVAYPPIWTKPYASQKDRNLIVRTLAKVTSYVNNVLVLNGTLPGSHKYDENVGIHLGVFAVYEYQPDVTGVWSRVIPHLDSDYEGRCLSAALHLDNWMDMQKPTNSPIKGGAFQVLRCNEGLDCTGAYGDKYADMIDQGLFTHSDDNMHLAGEAEYKPGRLALFLPENPHTVTPLLNGKRSILFMWFHCTEFGSPPKKYPQIQPAVERAEARKRTEIGNKNRKARGKRTDTFPNSKSPGKKSRSKARENEDTKPTSKKVGGREEF